jgi:importin subunit beta-1
MFVYLQNDIDIMDYLNELRECCLEAYTGIVQGLKGEDKETIGNDVQLIHPHVHHVPHMINFITTIARDGRNEMEPFLPSLVLLGTGSFLI